MAGEFIAVNRHAIDGAAAVKVRLQLLRGCSVVDLVRDKEYIHPFLMTSGRKQQS